MKLIYNMKFAAKLSVMLLLPALGLLYFSISGIFDKKAESDEMQDLLVLANLSQNISAFVHESQKERGNTGGFLGSAGTAFVTELINQRKETDKKITALNALLSEQDLSNFGNEFNGLVNNATNTLEKIDSKREGISAMNLSAAQAIGYYTGMNTEFLNIITYVAKLSTNAEISTIISAYANFLLGKERAGVERAVMSNTFAVDNFEPGIFDRFSTLVTEQDTYNRVFLSFANADQKAFFEDKMSSAVVKEVQKMRDVAIAQAAHGQFGIDASYWSNAITAKINHLKQVEDKLANDLVSRTTVFQESANSTLIFDLASTVVILLISFMLALLIGKDIIKQLGGEPAEVFEIASEIADGNLAQEFDENRKEIGLYGAMKRMSVKLKEVMQVVKDAAENIASASSEMNGSSQQMSDEASQQASSAEEVSSSIEEMTTNIKQNTDNAKETEKIAIKASENISESSGSVNKTVDSMKTITDKISIIGEIARQTNLLALNAAVEAARAGEQGKGFAVVAAEIRRLAERSQTAATEINEVSSVSVDIAEGSGKLLQDIVPEIQKTADLVREITAASIDQASGSDQISNAIQSLNQIAQQSAAGAEEMAASAEELNGQAEVLKNSIAFFSLGENGDSNGNGRHVVKKKARKVMAEANGVHDEKATETTETKTPVKGVDIDLDIDTTNDKPKVEDQDYEKF